MNPTLLPSWCLLITGLLATTALADRPKLRTADEVLVVCNADSPISRAITDDYQSKRQVEHRILIHCPDAAVDADNETISYDDYKKLVATPIRNYLANHDEINFIVTTKGVPLRIEGAETGSRDVNSPATTPFETSLDSHLASIDYPDLPDVKMLKITGSGATGVSYLNRYYRANEPFTHAKFGGYLVTRLDGYTVADAKSLVERSLEAEQGLTYGKFLLDAQSDFGLGDKSVPLSPIPKRGPIKEEADWGTYNADMERAHDLLDLRKIPNELSLSTAFVGHRSNLLGYFSFGSNDSHYSEASYQSLTFAPGSISDTAVSTSARTFLPTTGGQSLLVDLIAHGLTCGKGYTDEPLLQAMASPAILVERYTSGYTMAESFYMASPFIGWQDVVVGDPLCCPYWGGYAGKIPASQDGK